MGKKPKIAVLFPAQPTSNHDVAAGYTRAFRLLGYQTDTIPYHKLVAQWSDYYRFFFIGSGRGIVNYDNQDVVRSASFNAVIKVMQSDPDILIIVDGTGFHKDAWEWTRKLGIYTVMVGTESPYHDNFVTHVANYADKVFVNELSTAEITGYEYLPVACDSEIHHPMNVGSTHSKDVVFVGSGFKERVEILEQVDWEGIDFEMYGVYGIDLEDKLAPFYKATSIANAEAAMLYAGSKISLNLNRTSSDYGGEDRFEGTARSLSPRAYEIAACGGFMISEYREEIRTIFGDWVPTFRTPEELNYLIHEWLPRDKDRAEIGAELAKIAKRHTYIERARRILESVKL